MAGKLTRRDFLRRVGYYCVGVAAIGVSGYRKWEAETKLLSASRFLSDSLAYALQLSRLKHRESQLPAAADARDGPESVIS